MAIAAVIRFPGSNCEFETAGALKKAGIEPFIYNWNQADRLALNRADAYVLPGGFSFQDRVRAGVIASRERMMDVIFEEAAYGKPVLGICNGARYSSKAAWFRGGSRERSRRPLLRTS